MTVSLRTVAITIIDVKVWTRKSEFPPGNFLRYITTTEITRQITFKLKDIEYDQIRYEIEMMECVQYCWENLINELPMHYQSAQEGMRQTNILCRTHVFCTDIVWCQLRHLHEC